MSGILRAICVSKVNSFWFFRCSVFWLASSMIQLPMAHGQATDDVKLRVSMGHYPFGAGYQLGRHTYDQKWIEEIITNPKSRPIIASVCKSLSLVSLKSIATLQGAQCPPIEERLAPPGSMDFVWTLTGSPSDQKIISRVRTPLKEFTPPSAACRAAEKTFIATDACEATLQVPLPAANEPARQFIITLDIVDRDDKRIVSRSQNVSLPPKSAPLIVSVGDSYASGEGNPDHPGKSKDDNFDPADLGVLPGAIDCEDDTTVMIKNNTKPQMKIKPVWVEPRDHRSFLSGPALAAKSLLDEWPHLLFLSFAKSGATIANQEGDEHSDVLISNDVLGQLKHAKQVLGETRIDALLISVGGNDVGFGNGLKTMAKDFRSNDGDKVKSDFRRRLSRLKSNGYPSIKNAIAHLKLNINRVFITEYPTALFENSNGDSEGGCGVFKSFHFWRVTKRDANSIRDMARTLNDTIAAAAKEHGWQLITGIAEGFRRHGYCTNDSYFRGAEESCDRQGDFDGMMHPNEKGTAVYTRAIAGELRREFDRLK